MPGVFMYVQLGLDPLTANIEKDIILCLPWAFELPLWCISPLIQSRCKVA